jgi:hypothetical protein
VNKWGTGWGGGAGMSGGGGIPMEAGPTRNALEIEEVRAGKLS